jgi:hypothetical protein
MCSSSGQIGSRRRWVAGAIAGLAAVCLSLSLASGFAQEAAPHAPPQHKPGFFESVGRFFDRSAENFRDSFRGARQRWDELGSEAAANNKEIGDKAAAAGKNAAEATKSAVDAVAKLPTARVVKGHERCVVAPNGAPDCLAAAELLCRKQGYATGKSMDFTSAEECPAKTLIGQASRDECKTTTFISSAMCQ